MFHQWLQQPSTLVLQPETVELLQSSITVQLVNSDNCFDLIAKSMKMQSFLQARPYVVYQWLVVLQRVHPMYANDPILHATQYEHFRKYIAMCNKTITDQAQVLDDDNVNNADKIVGDDSTKTRTAILEQCDEQQATDNDMNTHYSLVTEPHTILRQSDHSDEQCNDDTLEYILGTAKAFGINIPLKHKIPTKKKGRPSKKQKKKHPSDYLQLHDSTWQSNRSDEPGNEFTDFKSIMTGAFPQVFLLGKYYKSNYVPNSVQVEHLLLQFTNSAADCRELLFYIFDCKLRHKVIHNLSARVKSNRQAFDKYINLMKQDSFKDEIRQAAQEPKSKKAQTLIKSMADVLSFGTQDTILSSLLNKAAMAKGISMIQRHGPASIMLTVTPDDINDPTNVRLSMRNVSNVSFPSCCDENFFDHLRKNSTNFKPGDSDTKIPLSYNHRKKLAVQNPVALAYNFRAMLQNIITVLLGSPLDYQPGTNSKKVTTWWYQSDAENCSHWKGIFGHVHAYFGCVEVQQRGALHFHILVWGGVPPSLLEVGAYVPQLAETIGHVLDSMFCADMPKEYHLQDLVLRTMKSTRNGIQHYPKTKLSHSSMKHIPSYKNSTTNWDNHLYTSLQRTGIHEHTFTCKKPPQGSQRCRGAKPSALCDKTKPIFSIITKVTLQTKTRFLQQHHSHFRLHRFSNGWLKPTGSCETILKNHFLICHRERYMHGNSKGPHCRTFRTYPN